LSKFYDIAMIMYTFNTSQNYRKVINSWLNGWIARECIFVSFWKLFVYFLYIRV